MTLVWAYNQGSPEQADIHSKEFMFCLFFFFFVISQADLCTSPPDMSTHIISLIFHCFPSLKNSKDSFIRHCTTSGTSQEAQNHLNHYLIFKLDFRFCQLQHQCKTVAEVVKCSRRCTTQRFYDYIKWLSYICRCLNQCQWLEAGMSAEMFGFC